MFAQVIVLCGLLGSGEESPLKAFSTAASYEFTLRDSMPGPEVEGRYQKSVPVAFRSGGIDFFLQGEKLIYKEKETWEKSRTGTLSDPLRILGPSAKVRSARLPHEELAQLDKVWKNVKKTMDKGETLLSGELDEMGAKALSRTETRSVAQSGIVKVWLDPKGQVTKYDIQIRLLGRIGGADVDGTADRSVTVRNIGMTRVVVPDAAAKLLME